MYYVLVNNMYKLHSRKEIGCLESALAHCRHLAWLKICFCMQ